MYARAERAGHERSLSVPTRLAIIFFLGLTSWALVIAAVLLISWLA